MRGKSMENAVPVLCAPSSVSVTVRRPTRPREYLTEREIEKLIKAAGENRWGHRDATAVLIAYERYIQLGCLGHPRVDFAAEHPKIDRLGEKRLGAIL